MICLQTNALVGIYIYMCVHNLYIYIFVLPLDSLVVMKSKLHIYFVSERLFCVISNKDCTTIPDQDILQRKEIGFLKKVDGSDPLDDEPFGILCLFVPRG